MDIYFGRDQVGTVLANNLPRESSVFKERWKVTARLKVLNKILKIMMNLRQ